jgi:CBS domain-containing protein
MKMADAASSPPDRQWPSRSIAGPDVMVALQNSLPVALIATPRRELSICRSDETVAEVIRRNNEGFDHLPVIDGSRNERERIIGLIELVKFTDGRSAVGSVRDHAAPLTEDNLIGADAGILTFVKSADSHPCRLVLSGAEVTGLVSLSDLQRLPVRAALFALTTQFEMAMTAAIRRECAHLVDWKSRLSEGRLQRLMQKASDANAADNYVDDLLLTDFADKATIIGKSPHFEFSRSQFETDKSAAQRLRDNLAHANLYAETREAAKGLCATVRTIERWIERLSAWPRAADKSVEAR